MVSFENLSIVHEKRGTGGKTKQNKTKFKKSCVVCVVLLLLYDMTLGTVFNEI